VLFVIIFFSCSRENDVNIEDKNVNEKKEVENTVLSSFNLLQDVQRFELNLNNHRTIIGKYGTVVTFPMGCFGKIQGKIKITLIECYSIHEMIFNGLSTQTSKGKLLETEGMIYLNALDSNGDELKIEKGEVKIQMPTEQIKHDIKIFEGLEKGNQVYWNLSNVNPISRRKIVLSKLNDDKIIYSSASEDTFLQENTICSQSIIDKKIKNENLVNYVFSISKMGWQNCDRFIEGETNELIVNVPKESIGASYYLVLKKYNSSALSKQTTDGKLSFIIPINEPFTIVSLSSKGEGNIYFNMMDYTGGKYEVDFSGLKFITRQELVDLLIKKFGKNIWNRPTV
jgi:hypothetical protein